MMPTHKSKTITIDGGICGPIWWPVGVKCGKPLHEQLEHDDRIEWLLDGILMQEGGDFNGALFTADTTVTVTVRRVAVGDDGLRWSERTRTRQIPIASMPSLAHLVDEEAYTCDFMGEE